jgi:hypothetical protein
MTYCWPKRPRVLHHPILERRQRWTEKGGMLRVERFPDDGDPRYISLVAYSGVFRIAGRHHTLRAAIRDCQSQARVHARKKFKAASKGAKAQSSLF